MQVPDPEGRCLNRDCRDRACLGNRLQLTGGTLSLVMPHHKNESRWGRGPIQVELPEQLHDLVMCFLRQGHLVHSPSCAYLFSRQGRPYSLSGFSYHFRKLYSKAGAPASITPQRLRHIWVSERFAEDRAPGPDDSAAARIMGNSVAQWEVTYDIGGARRDAVHTAATMMAWRQCMLDRGARPSS